MDNPPLLGLRDASGAAALGIAVMSRTHRPVRAFAGYSGPLCDGQLAPRGAETCGRVGAVSSGTAPVARCHRAHLLDRCAFVLPRDRARHTTVCGDRGRAYAPAPRP